MKSCSPTKTSRVAVITNSQNKPSRLTRCFTTLGTHEWLMRLMWSLHHAGEVEFMHFTIDFHLHGATTILRVRCLLPIFISLFNEGYILAMECRPGVTNSELPNHSVGALARPDYQALLHCSVRLCRRCCCSYLRGPRAFPEEAQMLLYICATLSVECFESDLTPQLDPCCHCLQMCSGSDSTKALVSPHDTNVALPSRPQGLQMPGSLAQEILSRSVSSPV